MVSPRKIIRASLSVALAGLSMPASAGAMRGPSSSARPYVINVPPSVDVVSLLTVGDSVNAKPGSAAAYRMVGIPDGLGAFDNHDGTFTVLMNHELGPANGAFRRHGFTGAFVSRWIVRKSDLAVLHGGDLVKQVLEYNAVTRTHEPATRPLGRICSADLPAGTAFYNHRTGNGYPGRIFMDGEEAGSEGRAFAHLVTGPHAGVSLELPSLGKFSWENSVANPFEQDKTIVIGQDDSTPGQVYVYVGRKEKTGDEIEKAGLHGGLLYGVKVEGFLVEDDPAAPTRGPGIPSGKRFTLHEFGDVRSKTGAELQTKSEAARVTEFLRPEDGSWDTRRPNIYYFVTTDRFRTSAVDARSRLYRLTFDDVRNPERGGKIDMLLDGTERHQMLDNITVDGDGNLILQEDPGNQPYLAKIWKFYPRSKALVEIAVHDPARFAPPNQDEESSGVIEITGLLRRLGVDHDRDQDGNDDGDVDDRLSWGRQGYRYYLGVTQAHSERGDAELVEGGQMYILAVPRTVR
jgi:hypothetical protein